MRRLLILGGSGFIGKALFNELYQDEDFDIYGTYYKNTDGIQKDKFMRLDINNMESLDIILDSLKPDIIVSCLRGEYDAQLKLHIRAAEYLKETGGMMYFCSTANVFENSLDKPHYEDEEASACSEYGRYKIECENQLKHILNKNICIVRLPQIWGRNSPRMEQLTKCLTKCEEIEVYPNVCYNTNTDIMLSMQLHYLIRNNYNGVIHLAALGITNHRDFYLELIRRLGYGNYKIKENFEERGYHALLSNTAVLPESLTITNNLVIEYLSE